VALYGSQAAEKLVLAEGSKMMMAAFESHYNQGVYGLVTNLGSLVVRTIFQVRTPSCISSASPKCGLLAHQWAVVTGAVPLRIPSQCDQQVE
jgi:hypothetical protein